jgi:hypothetical protein
VKIVKGVLTVWVLIVVLCGCASDRAENPILRVIARIEDENYLTMEGFTDGGYSERGVLIEVIEPARMKGELIAIPLFSTFSGKETLRREMNDILIVKDAWIAFEIDPESVESNGMLGYRQIDPADMQNLRNTEQEAAGNPSG